MVSLQTYSSHPEVRAFTENMSCIAPSESSQKLEQFAQQDTACNLEFPVYSFEQNQVQWQTLTQIPIFKSTQSTDRAFSEKMWVCTHHTPIGYRCVPMRIENCRRRLRRVDDEGKQANPATRSCDCAKHSRVFYKSTAQSV